jgi:hypothetical protein
MRIRNHIAITMLAVAAYAPAHARSISYDSWSGPNGTGTGNSISFDAANPLPYGLLADGVTSLVLAPGIGSSSAPYSFFDNSNLVNQSTFPPPKGDMFVWKGTDATGQPADEQIVLTTSSNQLVIQFNYDAADAAVCSGQFATLAINHVTYKAGSPCGAGTVVGGSGAGVDITGFNSSQFVFDTSSTKVQLEALPSGWNAVAAPELDPRSSVSALTLLFGGLAVLRARRSAASG